MHSCGFVIGCYNLVVQNLILLCFAVLFVVIFVVSCKVQKRLVEKYPLVSLFFSIGILFG